jgi:CubicO group peptidase (beta-lactamase class C family)
MSVAALSQSLDAIAEKHHLGALWFHIEQGGTVLANLGIRGASPDAPEPVGSLSKSITGIAIALLIQDGKLTLDRTVGEVLGNLYAQHHRSLDASIKDVTIERLLTHTAGLRPNKIADPVNGLESESVLRVLRANANAFDFLNASNGDHSSGESNFVYSNMSFLMLGLVVEAVSGQSYEDFCRTRIFQPLKITDESLLGGRYRPVASYSGWILSRNDIAKIWFNVFDRSHPTLLTAETLSNTLFAPLGQSVGKNHDAHYVMGAYVRPSADHSAYRIWHNGVQSTFLLETGDHKGHYSYLEDNIPGSLWIFATSPVPPEKEWSLISADIRSLVDTTFHN